MYDELTAKDIEKMQEELDYRIKTLRPQYIEEVKRTRAFGDLSENFEYKEAKRVKNRNDSRIRYLENMIRTAKIIDISSSKDKVGLFDKVKIYIPEDDETQLVQVVTTVRCDPLSGLISKESPLGAAILGRQVGERVVVNANDNCSYTVEICEIEKSEDDGSAPLLQY
jgi:transcription elongation factor GreA